MSIVLAGLLLCACAPIRPDPTAGFSGLANALAKLDEEPDPTEYVELVNADRGAVGKTAVVGMKSRGASQNLAECVAAAGKPALHGFVFENTAPDTIVYTETTLQEGFSPVVDLTVL